MWNFVGGTIFGLALSVSYVWYGVSLPSWLELPDAFKRSLNAAVVDEAVFDPDTPQATRLRAIEVYFANQAKRAAGLEVALGYPLTRAMQFRRMKRQAQILRSLWPTYDKIFEHEALRKSFEVKYGTGERDSIKRAMLLDALAKKPALGKWLTRHGRAAHKANVIEVLREVAVMQRAPG